MEVSPTSGRGSWSVFRLDGLHRIGERAFDTELARERPGLGSGQRQNLGRAASGHAAIGRRVQPASPVLRAMEGAGKSRNRKARNADPAIHKRTLSASAMRASRPSSS